MSTISVGGNEVRSHSLPRVGKLLFAGDPYVYYLGTWPKGTVRIDGLSSFTVFVKDMEAGTKMRLDGKSVPLDSGDALQAEGQLLDMEIVAGGIQVLVAGTKHASGLPVGKRLTKKNSIYKVVKPWGHELWINGQHPAYSFKEVFLKKGSQTSLQYHRHKQETNVLFQGEARLVYKANSAVHNDDLAAHDLGVQTLAPIASIGIMPGVVHRLVAQTDLLLYEVSTPHLDDVIRLQDDANRPNGRIEAEHRQ